MQFTYHYITVTETLVKFVYKLKETASLSLFVRNIFVFVSVCYSVFVYFSCLCYRRR